MEIGCRSQQNSEVTNSSFVASLGDGGVVTFGCKRNLPSVPFSVTNTFPDRYGFTLITPEYCDAAATLRPEFDILVTGNVTKEFVGKRFRCEIHFDAGLGKEVEVTFPKLKGL